MSKAKLPVVIKVVLACSLVPFIGIFIAFTSGSGINIPKDSFLTAKTEVISSDTLLASINRERLKDGLTPFTLNAKLNESSKLKCDDMVNNNYYDHMNPSTQKQGYSYIKDVGVYYLSASENLNLGNFRNADEVVESWMSSKPHADSIKNAKYTDIGFATCTISTYPNQIAIVQHKIEPITTKAQDSSSTQTKNSSSTLPQQYNKLYTPSRCTTETIPYKTIYKDADWIDIGKQEIVNGSNGTRYLCSASSDGTGAMDYTVQPIDKVVYTGTHRTVTEQTPDQNTMLAAKSFCTYTLYLTVNSVEYNQCIQTYISQH